MVGKFQTKEESEMKKFDVIDEFERTIDTMMLDVKKNSDKLTDDLRRLKMSLARMRVAEMTEESKEDENA